MLRVVLALIAAFVMTVSCGPSEEERYFCQFPSGGNLGVDESDVRDYEMNGWTCVPMKAMEDALFGD